MTNNKVCNKCGQTKPLDEFRTTTRQTRDGIKQYCERSCKKCNYESKKERVKKLKTTNAAEYKKIIDKQVARDKNYYDKNKERIKKRNNKYYAKNKKSLKQQRKEYRKNNPEKVKKWKKVTDTTNGKLSWNYRRRVRKEIGSGKGWSKLLGCSTEHLKKWFEFNFNIDSHIGMSWDNYGTVWEIDHVAPCCMFDMANDEHVAICFSWTNTLPITVAYNQTKNGKVKYIDIMKLEMRLKLFSKLINSNTH